MRVLHTHWQPPPEPDKSGRLLLWAETAATPPARRRGRLHTKQAKPHPFVETSGQLKQLLADLLPPDTGLWSTGKADLWLPTGNFGPQPSPQLSHDWAVEISPPAGLAPWTVSGLRVGPVEAVSLLLGLTDSDRLPAGVRLGTDTQFWQTVVRLGLELLAQQKIVPTLAQAGNQFHGRWLPVLDGPEDASRLAWLQQAMPVLCRAETSRLNSSASPLTRLSTSVSPSDTISALLTSKNPPPAKR